MLHENSWRRELRGQHRPPESGHARRHHGEDEAPGAESVPEPGFRHEPAFGRGRGQGHGPGPWSPRGFRGFAHALGRGRGPFARRGDVRIAVLALLAEQPMHGYQVMQQLAERSGGRWYPSAGSVYPTLQQLEDEGLVRSEERDGRRVYTVTDAGAKAAAAAGRHAVPWGTPDESEGVDLRDAIFSLIAAAGQVAEVGRPETVERARSILIDARRSLYRLLAEDETAHETPATTERPAAGPATNKTAATGEAPRE